VGAGGPLSLFCFFLPWQACHRCWWWAGGALSHFPPPSLSPALRRFLGQTQAVASGDLDSCKRAYAKKFQEKTKNTWSPTILYDTGACVGLCVCVWLRGWV
jgi:hypothetical protein